MQPLFQTSGWSLPTNIAADTKKKQKSGDDDATTTKMTKDADQLQAQFNQLGPKKDKKKRDRQKSDSNSQTPAKKTKIDQEEKPAQQKQQQPKKQPVQKKQDLGSQDKDHTTKKAQHPSSKDQPSQQQQQQSASTKQSVPDSNNKSKKNKKKNDPSLPVVDASKPEKVNPSKEKKPMDASKKNKLKELLNKSKTQPQPVKKSMENTPTEPVKATKTSTTEPGLTALQLKMKDKLSGARFRWLNEKLYTTEGNEAYTLFQEKPELFDEYHEGFRHQVESWPVNPVDLILEQLSKMPKGTVVADLGCGDAVIGHTLKKQKVLSYDLIAKNDKVIACDITKLPLSANAVDVVVFSLSLMGTNYLDFLKEAHRILKEGGEMKIAEVVSRFSDIDGFIDLVESLGFDFMEKDDDNKMFVMLYFTKRPELNMVSDALDEEMLEGLTKNKKRALQQGAGVKNNMNKLRKKSQSLQTLFKRNDYDLDRTLTNILDHGTSQYSADQTTASAIAKIVMYRLNHIQNLPSASTDSVQKEMAFLYGEYATWTLLDSIQRSSCPLQQCSNIRDWINSRHNHPIPDCVVKDTMEEELDAEIQAMLTFSSKPPTSTKNSTPMMYRKRMICLDSDDDDDDGDNNVCNFSPTNISQRRRTTQDDQFELEKTNEALYGYLRKNDLEGAIRFCIENCEPWFTTVINAYIQQCKKIQQGHAIVLEAEQQALWRASFANRLKKGTFGPYGKATYGLLLGDVDMILPVCTTWDDVVWAYYSARMESTLDRMAEAQTITEDTTRLDKKHQVIAYRKDTSLPRKHPGHFFHFVQTHLLGQNFDELFRLACKNPENELYAKAFIIRNDPDIRYQMDRFMAALAVYVRRYLNAPSDDSNADLLIRHYAKRNQYPPTFYPTVLAFYASQINEDLQVELFAHFLMGFKVDDQERKLLIEVALQYRLHIKPILRRTYALALEHTGQKVAKTQTRGRCKDSDGFELNGPLPDETLDFLKALEWLLMEESVYGDAIKEVNRQVRKYLGERKVYLAETMVQAIPLDVLNRCVLQTHGGCEITDYLEEIQDHALLLECWRLFSSWDALQKEKPAATPDELETLERTLAWERRLLELTETLENRLLGFLNSGWLKGGSVTKSSADDVVRQIYISEAVLRLHRIQHYTKDLGNGDYSTKKDALIHLVASEKSSIYKDIIGCGKMGFIYKTINEQ